MIHQKCTAVSYTHLDVYKRQGYIHMARHLLYLGEVFVVSKAVGKGQIISRSEYIKRGYIESITARPPHGYCV